MRTGWRTPMARCTHPARHNTFFMTTKRQTSRKRKTQETEHAGIQAHTQNVKWKFFFFFFKALPWDQPVFPLSKQKTRRLWVLTVETNRPFWRGTTTVENFSKVPFLAQKVSQVMTRDFCSWLRKASEQQICSIKNLLARRRVSFKNRNFRW